MKICVFCSSSDNLDAKYVDAAKALGETIAARGHELVFGGYDKGLMGDVANAAVAAGGRVFGVTTTGLTAKGRAIVEGIENVEEPDLSTRIKHMVRMSDAFVTLPGGLGTFEEFFSVMSQIKAGELKATCALLDVDGYFKPLVEMLDLSCETGLNSCDWRAFCDVFTTPDDIIDWLEKEWHALLPPRRSKRRLRAKLPYKPHDAQARRRLPRRALAPTRPAGTKAAFAGRARNADSMTMAARRF